MEPRDAILVTGARGLVGTHLISYLRRAGFNNITSVSSADCDLMDRQATQAFFLKTRPSHVFHMAGFVRGIMGNMRHQAEAWLNNTLINTHVIEASQKAGVKKIVAMGTVAMYPDPLPGVPLCEDMLWHGAPHFSEYGYAQAKRGMLAQLQTFHESYGLDYAVALSTNLYGPYDRFDTETGHVIPSLIKKFHDAKKNGSAISVWGDGSAQRDFLHAADAVRGLHIIMDNMTGVVNLATGTTHRIRDAVDVLAAHTGLESKVVWDTSKPTGQTYRAYDIHKLTTAGFSCETTLEQGLKDTYDWYADNVHMTQQRASGKKIRP